MEWTAAMHYEESKRLLEQSGYMTVEGSGAIRYGEYDQRRNLLVASAQTHAMLANHQMVAAWIEQVKADMAAATQPLTSEVQFQ